jgi:hypothetical protein
MPPIQPSLRGTLLTSASAVALSVSGSATYAQNAAPAPPQTVSIWVEGAAFWTTGGSFNVPLVPGIGPPITAFNPKTGVEGAAGFDIRWPGNQLWHIVGDVRYGRTKTVTGHSSTFFSSLINPTNNVFVLQTSSTASSGTEKESHLVADFMIGRDLGVGSNAPELQFGVRVADLRASARVNTLLKTTFYSSNVFPPSITATATAVTSFSSRFFGAGPRLAATGKVPITGFWSFDYSGGIALLFGERKSNFLLSGAFGPLAINTNTTAFVFNADGWAAISYALTPNLKASAGVRGDYYNSPLMSYDINTGGSVNIDRLFWGPFVRLTGAF